MAMLRMATTRGQKAEVVIPTPHYTPSTPSPRHRYIIHHNTCHLRYRCLTPACIKKTHAHCQKIQYLNSSQLAVSTTPKPYTPPKRTLQCSIRNTDKTHIGGHARTRRASTPSSDPRLQPPPYPISSSANSHRLTFHSLGVGTDRVPTPAIVR